MGSSTSSAQCKPEQQSIVCCSDETNVVAPIRKCSDFYLACRNNEVEKVKTLLQTLPQDEIDRLEPNGSTALHAVAYHGHQGSSGRTINYQISL
jgi:ankyrin repeat protein